MVRIFSDIMKERVEKPDEKVQILVTLSPVAFYFRGLILFYSTRTR